MSEFLLFNECADCVGVVSLDAPSHMSNVICRDVEAFGTACVENLKIEMPNLEGDNSCVKLPVECTYTDGGRENLHYTLTEV